ncbi:MAG: hypothetical protein RR538_09195 [Erysipelotrichaceae bacterium]
MTKWDYYFDFMKNGKWNYFVRVLIASFILCWFAICFVVKIISKIISFICGIAMTLAGVWMSFFGFVAVVMTVLQIAGQGVTLWKTDPWWFVPLEFVCLLIAIFLPIFATSLASVLIEGVTIALDGISCWILEKLS